jgi:hypothetical protein
MKIYINNINVWLQGLTGANDLALWASNSLPLPEDFIPPKPQYYPKGQLRRLSPFSKVVMHCLDIPQALSNNLPLVFASQHGDLAKTVKLIKDTALAEDLSPTQFALSVHNATTGLFSIATNNTAETTTISAGKNTFIEGLVEAAMQSQQQSDSVIYSYCDFNVPQEYLQYEQEMPARCITLILSSQNKINNLATVEFALNNHCNKELATSDLSLNFIKHFYGQTVEPLQSKSYAISLVVN